MLGHECRHAWLVPDSMRFPGERGVERTPAMRMPQRRFPPPWSVKETDACFIEKPPRFGASNGRMEYVVAAIG
jgi:hypothetical protein